jgi:hypothetical protein
LLEEKFSRFAGPNDSQASRVKMLLCQIEQLVEVPYRSSCPILHR